MYKEFLISGLLVFITTGSWGEEATISLDDAFKSLESQILKHPIDSKKYNNIIGNSDFWLIHRSWPRSREGIRSLLCSENPRLHYCGLIFLWGNPTASEVLGRDKTIYDRVMKLLVDGEYSPIRSQAFRVAYYFDREKYAGKALEILENGDLDQCDLWEAASDVIKLHFPGDWPSKFFQFIESGKFSPARLMDQLPGAISIERRLIDAIEKDGRSLIYLIAFLELQAKDLDECLIEKRKRAAAWIQEHTGAKISKFPYLDDEVARSHILFLLRSWYKDNVELLTLGDAPATSVELQNVPTRETQKGRDGLKR
ncbi:MAG: hypothetical protein HS116_20135 [Planctomycetes bacterium]|nr:hypothetical protein [Planctomycetota bacterium]